MNRFKSLWRQLTTSRLVEQLLRDNTLLWENLHAERDLHRQHVAAMEGERLKTEYEQLGRLADVKTALAKTEKERDYFRARADRLELELLPREKPVVMGRPHKINLAPVGRRRWQDVQAEVAQRNAELDRQAAASAAPQPDAEAKAAS